jgi:SAM-dependent methyltransferase
MWKERCGRRNPVKLNMGCGRDYRRGWINLDLPTNKKADVRHDLNKFPYPFKDSSIDIIYMSHVLEHLQDPIGVLNELYRILSKHGLLVVRVPHYTGNASWLDITHVRPYSYGTLKVLEDKFNASLFGVKRFSKVDAKFSFWKKWYYPLNFIVEPLANKFPVYFESAWAGIFPPFEVIYFIYK